MRLLKILPNQDFLLTPKLHDDAIPQYAILSHTWGDENQEVTFEDMIGGSGRDKVGYDKIKFCGDQVARDGLQYFWVDSCCIKKSSDSELSESLNSMFRWYRRAAKCYVYLSDVSIKEEERKGKNIETAWEQAFRHSRWFTRGWTLQELLAPRFVEFFTRDGHRLGDKQSLEQPIQEITRIPISALRGSELSRFSVEQILDWAKNRQTTRGEDWAYSLLGIFGIFMPVLYGEGRESAINRLRKEIQGASLEKESKEKRSEAKQCLQDLYVTDACADKIRIEETKGGLLLDSYRWILENGDFKQWREDQQRHLLWIKGDPGKGKTMLLCGVIDELKKSMAETHLLSYFFCQATDSRINNATAVLRGLLYMLLQQQPMLISHIQKLHDYAGKKLFEDVNAWVAVSEIFTNILQDPILQNTYFIIDGLDECTEGLLRLLDFITQKSSLSPCVKWLVSSRNWPDIEGRLDQAKNKVRLCLELNTESISTAVNIYIKHKIGQLSREKKYDEKTQHAILNHLLSNANDTFLWVALVCQNLKDIPRGRIRARLNEFPPGLDSLYKRMMKQICESKDSELYKQILASIATLYEPVTLAELTSLVEALKESSDDVESLKEIVGLCGSFLVVQIDTVYFVHQSAKDYLLAEESDKIFPSGMVETHYRIGLRSLEVLYRTLRRDIYDLGQFGFLVERAQRLAPDPLLALRYLCIYWVDHLCEWEPNSHVNRRVDLQDGGTVEAFMREKFLYWLEALSHCKSMSKGVLAMTKLDSVIQGDKNALALIELIHDACRFVMYHKQGIETDPLQAYASALIFSPTNSLIRRFFKRDEPTWIKIKPAMEDEWSACLQTFETYSDGFNSVAYSHDSSWLASASVFAVVNIWDANSGACLQTFKGHSKFISFVDFSHDSTHLASASSDCTVRIWDISNGNCLEILEGHSDCVRSVAFSHDSTLLASASWDQTVKIWEASSGVCLRTLEGHSNSVNSVAFSHDSTILASASWDQTVKIWEVSSGACLRTLEDHSDMVCSVAFSHDSTLLASASWDQTVKIWEVSSFACLRMLEGHRSGVLSVVFSPDSTLLASSSSDCTVKIWDATGDCLRSLQHTRSVVSAAFSHNMTRLASVEEQDNIRIWDIHSSDFLQKIEDHSDVVEPVDFSHDSNQVASYDDSLSIRNATSGKFVATLEGHRGSVMSVAFSHDSTYLASASNDCTVRIWDTCSGNCLKILEGHSDRVHSVAFSHDSTLLASASDDCTVKVWSASGVCERTFEGHSNFVRSFAFSHDSTILASASWDQTVKIWEVSSGAYLRTLEGHTDSVSSVAFSHDSTLLASSSWDRTLRIWDASSGDCLEILESEWTTSMAFSNDSTRLASSSNEGTMIWDVRSGECLQTLYLGCPQHNLRFATTDLHIHSDHGTFAVDAPRALKLTGKVEHPNPWVPGVGLSPNGKWITYNSNNLVWIPPDYRPRCSDISGRKIAIGVGSGRVWMCDL